MKIYHKNNENIKFSSFLFKKQYPPSLPHSPSIIFINLPLPLPYKNDGKFIFPLFLYIMEQK
jgi:hypothetical protein